MARKRDGLVPIGGALSGMGGSVKTIREASPQARHHFTLADQVNQLVSANEADPDRGFMARLMALCYLTPMAGDIFILDCPENDKWLEVVFRSTCRL